MRIFVDADACPREIKDLLLRAASRSGVQMTFVANQFMRLPETVDLVQVAAGPDVADERIVELAGEGDLVVTADIPLAGAAVAKGALAVSPRGQLFTERNVGQRLATRDLLTDLRNGGVELGGPPALTQQDCHAFANQLDRFLARRRRRLQQQQQAAQ